MIKISGKVTGLPEMTSALAQLPSLLRQAGMAAMTESLQYVGKIIRDDYLMGPHPTEIERRSGSFRATFQRGHAENIFEVQAQGTQILGTFGSRDKRAHILNDGGVIRSTRPGGFLAIRTEFTKTASGAVQKKYQQPLRNLPNTFVAKHTVFEKFGKRIVPIAWLRRFVTIVGRHFMEKGEKKATPGIQTIFQQKFDTVVTRLNDTLQKIRGSV